MIRFTILCIVAFALSFTKGSVVSPEWLLDKQLSDFQLPLNFDKLNLTDSSPTFRGSHPHEHLNITEIIELYHYKSEVYEISTDDGYILTLHRIPGNSTVPKSDGKPVAFLMHGLLCSAMDWVLTGPERGLAFLLSDAGYDVWLGNARGNKYCHHHKTLSSKSSKFWDFSWHEIGEIDLKTMVDFVLQQTGRKKIHYVGHSQGSTTFFVMLSKHPEYSSKFHAMFSLAPVAYCSHMFSPFLQLISKVHRLVGSVASLIGHGEFHPSNKIMETISSKVCSETSILQSVCSNAMFLITGFNHEQLDVSLLPTMLANVPAGASVKQMLHYAQMINSGHFRQYDHGWWKNLKEYGRMTPPSYKLSNVKTPVSLHYSVNDWLSDSVDVEKLSSKLPNVIGKFRVPNDKFNHIDFLWARDVKVLLFDKIMNLMDRYKD